MVPKHTIQHLYAVHMRMFVVKVVHGYICMLMWSTALLLKRSTTCKEIYIIKQEGR